jgi:hypothetical protein
MVNRRWVAAGLSASWAPSARAVVEAEAVGEPKISHTDCTIIFGGTVSLANVEETPGDGLDAEAH